MPMMNRAKVFILTCVFTYLTFSASFTQAAAIYDVGRVLDTVRHSDGVWYMIQHRVRDGSQTFTINRAVKVPKAALGTVAKARMFTPAGLALQAAMVGVGLFIDDVNDEVLPTDPATWEPTFPAADGEVRIVYVGSWSGPSGCTGGASGVNVHPSIGHALEFIIANCNGPLTSEQASYIYDGEHQCYINDTRIDWRDDCGSLPTSRFQILSVDSTDLSIWDGTDITQNISNTIINEIDNPGPTPLTETDIANAVFDHPAWEDLLENLAYDDQFDQLNSNVAAIAAMIADLLNDIDDWQAMNPPDAPISDEDTDIETIREIVPGVDDTSPLSPSRPSTGELQEIVEEANEEIASGGATTVDLCTNNPDILACEDISGTGVPGDVTVELIDPETAFTDLYNLTGSGTPAACPAPSEFTLPETFGGETIVLDNALICDSFENVARPILLLCAYFAAALILIRGAAA